MAGARSRMARQIPHSNECMKLNHDSNAYDWSISPNEQYRWMYLMYLQPNVAVWAKTGRMSRMRLRIWMSMYAMRVNETLKLIINGALPEWLFAKAFVMLFFVIVSITMRLLVSSTLELIALSWYMWMLSITKRCANVISLHYYCWCCSSFVSFYSINCVYCSTRLGFTMKIYVWQCVWYYYDARKVLSAIVCICTMDWDKWHCSENHFPCYTYFRLFLRPHHFNVYLDIIGKFPTKW